MQCLECGNEAVRMDKENKDKFIQGIDFSTAPDPAFARGLLETIDIYQCANCKRPIIDVASALIAGDYYKAATKH